MSIAEKLKAIAENEPKVYNAGYTKGEADGYAKGLNEATPTLQEKTITENGEYTADAGYDGLSKVTVNVASGGETDTNPLQQLIEHKHSIDYLFYTNLSSYTPSQEFVDNTLRSIVMTNNVTSAIYAFYYCERIKYIPLFDTSKIEYMSNFASMCSMLNTIPQLDVRSATSLGTIAYYCASINEIWIKNIKTNLQVGSGTLYGHRLTVDSLVHLCYELRDTGSSKKLTVGTANLAKLADVYVKPIEITDEMRAEDDLIDEKLPFVRCESTDEGATLITDYVVAKNWTIA